MLSIELYDSPFFPPLKISKKIEKKLKRKRKKGE